jgi:hypothetical protein
MNVFCQITQKFKISLFCLILENKTDVGLSDNVVSAHRGAQFAHLVCRFREKIEISPFAQDFKKILIFLKNAKNVCKLSASIS